MAKRTKRPNRTTGTKRGPKPDALTIEGEWETAVRRALEKKRPKKGWPRPKKGKGK